MLCITCTLRKWHPTQQINPAYQPPSSSSLTHELKDLYRFSFNSLLTLLAILSLSGSKTLAPVVLALLTYTIGLRLTVNPCFIQNYPILARFLHVIPLLGTFCTAGVELATGMQSPTLAVIVLLLSVSPFVTTIHHHGEQCEETPLPVRIRESPFTVSGQSVAASTSR